MNRQVICLNFMVVNTAAGAGLFQACLFFWDSGAPELSRL